MNLSPDTALFTAPIQIPFIIPNDNLQKGAYFGTMLLGGRVKQIFDSNYSLFARADAYLKRNHNQRPSNYDMYRFETGASKGFGSYEISLPIRAEEYVYGGRLYRRSGAVGLELSKTVNANRIIGGLLEYRVFDYPHFKANSLGLLALAGKWQEYVPDIFSEIDTRLYVADGSALHPHKQFLAKYFYGFQIVGTFKKNPDIVPFAAFDIQNAVYNARDPNFLKVRQDFYYNISTGIIFQIIPNLFFQPDINFERNRSTIALNTFNQFIAEATILYNFA